VQRELAVRGAPREPSQTLWDADRDCGTNPPLRTRDAKAIRFAISGPHLLREPHFPPAVMALSPDRPGSRALCSPGSKRLVRRRPLIHCAPHGATGAPLTMEPAQGALSPPFCSPFWHARQARGVTLAVHRYSVSWAKLSTPFPTRDWRRTDGSAPGCCDLVDGGSALHYLVSALLCKIWPRPSALAHAAHFSRSAA
jgi:hypothetical protein